MNYDVLITGAAGFIGSNLVKLYNEFSHQGKIYLADDLGSDEKWQNLRDLKFYDYIPKDQLIAEIPKIRPQITYHLGACSATTEKNADYLYQNNTLYSERLFRALLDNPPPQIRSFSGTNKGEQLYTGPRFIYASSAATYGSGQEGFSDHYDLNPSASFATAPAFSNLNAPLIGLTNVLPSIIYNQTKQANNPFPNLTTPLQDLNSLRPLNIYGYSKHLFDLFARDRGWFKNYYCLGIKYFNVYGPREDHKGPMQSVVLKAVKTIQEKNKIELFESNHKDYKDGEQQRDFIYVKDAVYFSYLLAHLPEKIGGLFNLGTGTPRSFNDLALAVFAALKMRPKIEYIPMPAELVAKYQNYTAANMEKSLAFKALLDARLQKKTQVFPFFSLEDGVKDYITQYLVDKKATQYGEHYAPLEF